MDLLGQGASVPFNGGVRRATEWFQLEETYGDFQLASQHRPINRTQVAFQLFDANADGRNDLLAYLDRDIMVWENAGSGLAEPKLLGSLDAVVASLQSIDVDGDGHTDIVVQTGQQANQWLRNEGDFQFTAVASPLPAAVTFADWDGDGDADAIQQSDLPNIEFSVRLNTGNAQFDEATALFSVGPDAFDVMTVNLDDDSADELLITTESGVSWYRLDSDGSIGSQHIVGQPAVWLRDINGDGRDEVLVDAADGLIAYAFDPDTNSLVAPQTALGIGIYQDFNADGLIDYVGSEFSSPRQNAIRYGLPDGGFGDVQAAEHILLAEEFSGDNRTDAIGKIGDSFYYLLNQEATLEFIRRESIEWLVDMESLALLDVDGDQDLDIVVAADAMLYWFENIEPGRYANDARRLVDHFENYFDHLPIITTHDFDSDGDQDLLLVADEEGGVSWVENKGAGLFVEHVVARTSENENGFAVATGDINQDGAIDLLAADFAGNTLRWYENSDADPANRFLPSEPIAVSLLPSQVDLLDVDGDQDLDIVFIESLALHVLRNDGAGSFGAEETYATGESFYRYVADDLGNDGLVEVIWSDAGRIRAVQFTGSELREIDLQLPTDDVAWMEKDDVDGDGLNELVIGTFTGVEIWSWQNGRFEPSPWELAAFDYGIDYAFGDVNQDQRIEVVQLDWNDIGVYRQTANGAFELQQHVGLGWSEISNTAVGDIDGNGTSDLVVASGGGLHWRANQVWGIPTEPIEIAARSSGYAPIVADVDGDGDGDVLAHDGQQLVWHANGQNGQTWTSHVVGSAFDDWQTGDLNGDGNLDVVVMTESQLAWYRNLGQGQFAELETLRSVGENRLFHVADVDHDGSSDVVLVRLERNVGMQVEWIRSVNGSLEEPQVMAKLPSRALPETIDWTQDGLLDLILFHDGTISLFENLGDGQFSEMQTLASNW
ncbi:MAG: VCBS repeat-containing protein, partial [Planctomycetales bacterium]|nr:VCBS repeat-containing protein [Planctomycetales bacterium]